MKKTTSHEMLDELVKLTARLDHKPPGPVLLDRGVASVRQTAEGMHEAHRQTTSIRIYQYFDDDLASARPEEDVIPLRVRSGNDRDLHHKISLDLEDEMKRSGVEKWGLFSWQMKEQTGLTVSAIKAIVEKKSGYDAYVIHPDPAAECLSENPWIHGEHEIGGFLTLISRLSDQLGIELGDLKAVHPRNGFLYGNHIIGTARFWRMYNGFADRANGEFMATLKLDSLNADQWAPSRNRPEIGKLLSAHQKRLVSLFMSGPGKGLKVLKINPAREQAQERDWVAVAGYLRERHLNEMSQETRNYWLMVRDFCRHQQTRKPEET